MIRQEENTVDASTEKHVPVVETQGQGVLVRVGSVPHPMEEAHHLQWIEVMSGPWLYVKGLKAGDKPEAAFPAWQKMSRQGVLQSPRVVVQQAAQPVNRTPTLFLTRSFTCAGQSFRAAGSM